MSRPVAAEIILSNLRYNYRLLSQRAATAAVMAVVKANAYGHDLGLISTALASEGCRQFAVTDAEEGCKLRQSIGKMADIVLLSGVFDAQDAEESVRSDLTPVITTEHQVRLLITAGFDGQVWLKVDTGMQRLGTEDLAHLYRTCRTSGLRIAGVMSHLACADTPGHPCNSQQLKKFRRILSSVPSGTCASLLNSAGLATMPELSFDAVRPGIALYGIEPVNDLKLGLRPVMRLTGSVMQIREIPKGATVSYGATYTADRDMRVAVICLGYADGLPRALSNHGAGVWRGVKIPIAGRICMDYCILDAGSRDIHPGDAVEFWGEKLLASEVADSIGTITYELFTHLGVRVPRVAVERFQ